MSGSITLSGGTTSGTSGSRTLGPFTVINTNDVGETIVSALISGDNTFAVPANAVGVVIIPPTLNPVITWLLRTSANSSDTGLPLHYAHPTPVIFPATAPTTITIRSSAALTTPLTLWFW